MDRILGVEKKGILMHNAVSRNYCFYYTARLERSRCWLVSSLLRGTEHVAFDRSYDPQESIFEFFVPESMESVFLQVMAYLEKKGVASELIKKENRVALGQSLERSRFS